MSKANVTDILLLAFISGVVALLTSVMGISGTIIGAVVTSLVAESLKAYFKDPIKEKISERESRQYNEYEPYEEDVSIQDKFTRNNYQYKPRRRSNYYSKKSDDSFLTARILYIFPLVVILIIELIHFLGAIGIIPYDIFFTLESITNYQLLTTIGYALIVMGIYPLFSSKFDNKVGVVLIIVGIVELIFGYADSVSGFYRIASVLGMFREYLNIAIILAILYTILTIPTEKEDNDNREYYF